MVIQFDEKGHEGNTAVRRQLIGVGGDMAKLQRDSRTRVPADYYSGYYLVLLSLNIISCGQRPKTGIPGPFGAKNRCILKSSKKLTPRALPWVHSGLYLFLAGYSPGTPEFVYSA